MLKYSFILHATFFHVMKRLNLLNLRRVLNFFWKFQLQTLSESFQVNILADSQFLSARLCGLRKFRHGTSIAATCRQLIIVLTKVCAQCDW